MFRNKEIKNYILLMVILGIIGTMIAGFVTQSLAAALLVLGTAVLLTLCSVFFTKWRYNELDKLTLYLRRIIANEDFTLDIRDNYEGELSILKNEIYKVTQMLSEQKELLKKEKVHLTDAISDISHQLKTPLTSMMVMTDLLSDGQLPEEQRKEFTRKIKIQLERIEWLVSSLLKLSKIDAGTANLKKEKVNVKELIEKALEPMLIPMEIKEQSLTVEGDDSVSFIGDLRWTVEAIINILKNCVEHTPEGGAISIKYSENPLYTEIVISDNGIGIAKEDMPYVFKRFFKGKNASEGSIGIGLSMAHSIIKNQSGDIEVRSNKGSGTSFYIKFYKQVI